MTTCRWPGCTNPADTIVRLAEIGIRNVCAAHLQWATEQGVAFSIVNSIEADGGPVQSGPARHPVIQPPSAGPLARRIAALQPEPDARPEPVATWRRWIRDNASAKDMTGALR